MSDRVGDVMVPTAAASTARRAPRFVARIAKAWTDPGQGWAPDAPAGPTTLFQSHEWLNSFYRALAATGGAEPLVATVVDGKTGALAMRLPLIRRRRGTLATIEFADLDLTDYNAPMLGPAAPTTPEGAQAAFKALKSALKGADLVRFMKMPLEISGRPNPLALLRQARPSSLFGQPLVLGEDFTAWRFALPREFRKELERSWRVFTRDPAARFRQIEDPAEALVILAKMSEQQRERLAATGQDYRLDEPLPAAFYRDLIATGLAGGYVLMTVLMAGDELVAGMVAVRNAGACLIIRLSNAGSAWSKVSPGRLLIMQTLEHMHARGYRLVDFSIGDYDYKRRFGIGSMPLADLSVALSPAGLPAMLRARTAAALRARPDLDRRVRAFVARVKR